MLKPKHLLLLLCLVFVTYHDVYAQKYIQISTEKQQESKEIIVYEFFWYGCPHCFNIEPTMNLIESNLQKDTIIVKVPVVLRDTWMAHAKAYYTLKQMNLDDDLHEELFNEIHINGDHVRY